MASIAGNIIDLVQEKIFKGVIHWENQRITLIESKEVKEEQYILPGFVDAHVHIESSMLTPAEFGRLALPHGTIATVSDPHEIANVLGIDGVYYMLKDALRSPLKFNFGAPSCVPATTFETAGAVISLADIEELFQRKDIRYLSEMMNFPGVLYADPKVMAILDLAKKYKRPIDGHAPGLRGETAKKYIDAGISTDHECFTLEEAQDKLKYGMKILIREGSAAKNFEALIPLLKDHHEHIMFCSDDKHPNDLVVSHIDELVRRCLSRGEDLIKVLKAACLNPVKHYGLEVGLLQKNDLADFIVVNNIKDFKVQQTYINGDLVAENGFANQSYQAAPIANHFNTDLKAPSDFKVEAKGKQIRVIEAMDGQLITNELQLDALIKDGQAVSNVDQDILKIAVVNRYSNQPPAIAFIKNIGLKRGAIASSVAHDSHNIVVVGVDDESICKAVNLLIEAKGGLSLVDGEKEEVLALPVAGIMTNENAYLVAGKYTLLDQMAKDLGTPLKAPYMTLSFMALLVIPNLKLSDKGLFSGNDFKFTDLFIS